MEAKGQTYLNPEAVPRRGRRLRSGHRQRVGRDDLVHGTLVGRQQGQRLLSERLHFARAYDLESAACHQDADSVSPLVYVTPPEPSPGFTNTTSILACTGAPCGPLISCLAAYLSGSRPRSKNCARPESNRRTCPHSAPW